MASNHSLDRSRRSRYLWQEKRINITIQLPESLAEGLNSLVASLNEMGAKTSRQELLTAFLRKGLEQDPDAAADDLVSLRSARASEFRSRRAA
jgi:hypothetical protein